MRPRIVFATNNAHKLEEVRKIAGDALEVLSLEQAGVHQELIEDSPTLRQNALQKALQVKRLTGLDCFADDTGLEVEALNGAPGVHSARYAPGPGHDSVANMRLLLANMQGCENRRARFVTWIALLQGNEDAIFFEGEVRGTITKEPVGSDGFGYDPIFKPKGTNMTFAQMSADAKNAISHRGRATSALMQYLLHR